MELVSMDTKKGWAYFVSGPGPWTCPDSLRSPADPIRLWSPILQRRKRRSSGLLKFMHLVSGGARI